MRRSRSTFGRSSLVALAIAAAATLAYPLQLSAQRRAVGLLVGVNSSQIVDEELSSDRRTSWVGGVYAKIVIAGPVSFRPELVLTNKGAKSGGDIDLEVRMGYLQLPLMLNIDLTRSGPIRPFVFGGPAFAFLATCDAPSNVITGGDVTVNCSDLEGGNPFKATEYSGIIGAGVDFQDWGLGVRYDHGLSKINDDEAQSLTDVKLRTITFFGTVRLGSRRGD